MLADAAFCANREEIACNWKAEDGPLCRACAMTETVPDLREPDNLPLWERSEHAKRWVIANLVRWGWFTPQDTGARPVFKMLSEQTATGEADVIMTTEAGVDQGGETLMEVPLRWIGAPDGQAYKSRPLRVAFCRSCGFREFALARLDAENVSWELAVDSDSDMTVDATISADLAVTARLQGHAPTYVKYLEDGLLPDLGTQNINLYAGNGKTAITEVMVDYIRQGMMAVRGLSRDAA